MEIIGKPRPSAPAGRHSRWDDHRTRAPRDPLLRFFRFRGFGIRGSGFIGLKAWGFRGVGGLGV